MIVDYKIDAINLKKENVKNNLLYLIVLYQMLILL